MTARGTQLPAILLSGATATGKTGVALKVAESLPCEVVSMDSAMVYRGMDIGTAKPGTAERAAVPHHLVDIRDPADSYSAAAFARDAAACIEQIRGRGKLPLVVGGTLLYARALVQGLSDLPQADRLVREALSARAERDGWPALHAELRRMDPAAASRIHPNDAQRIQRALEIRAVTGQTPSSLQNARRGLLPGPALHFALEVADRDLLHERIAQRFQGMMDTGFLEEVRVLHQRGDLHPGLPAMRCVGYRQLWRHLDGDYDLDEAVYRGIVATRQLAKRQLTWLRNNPGDIPWRHLDALNPEQAVAEIITAARRETVLTE